MYFDDIELTPEELSLYFSLTKTRIKYIELKILKRLFLTEEQKEFYKLIEKLKYDKEFKEIFILLLNLYS